MCVGRTGDTEPVRRVHGSPVNRPKTENAMPSRKRGGGVRIVLDEPSRIGEFFAAAHLNRVFELFADDHSAVTGFGAEPTVG